MTLTVTATSTTSGTAVITNNTKGKSVTHKFTGGVDGTLCETNAEWIVEVCKDVTRRTAIVRVLT